MEHLKRFLTVELKINDNGIFNEFELYNDLILDWNNKVNLISRKQENIEKNILDSVFFLTKHQLKGDENIIDIGTGGGFPGIPLKILYPGLRLTLLDSTQKKITAVNEIITVMGLNNTNVVWGRAEEKSKEPEFKDKFDVAIALAVSSLGNIYKWCRDFLNKKGYMVCLKGGDITDELEAINNLKTKADIDVIKYTFHNFQDILPNKKAVIIKDISQ